MLYSFNSVAESHSKKQRAEMHISAACTQSAKERVPVRGVSQGYVHAVAHGLRVNKHDQGRADAGFSS